MAAPKKTVPAKTALAKATTGTSIANIDAQLDSEVANIKNQVGQASGNKISVEVNGDFVLPDGANLGNEIQVVVLDFVGRNNFYDQIYNAQNPAPPACYAIGPLASANDPNGLMGMAPEPDSPAVQHDTCNGCWANAFNSAANGKAKACQNRRLAAVLVVDPENPEGYLASDATIYTLDLSPSNIKSFDGAISYATKSVGHYIKVIFTVTAKNAGTYALVTFGDPIPNSGYAANAGRRGECADMLQRKPDFTRAAPAAPARGRGAAAAPRRPAATRR